MSAMRAFRGERIYLNVYDLSPANQYIHDFGVGVYHSGVQVGSTEYTFGGHEGSSTGIFTHSPKQAPGAQFRISIDMGETSMSSTDVRREVQALGEHFAGTSYHIVLKNCNHFSREFVLRLTGQAIPSWVNRLANMGSLVSCLLPKGMGVHHPESSDVQSQSTLDRYRKSGASAHTAFAGQGMSLAPRQESMAPSRGDVAASDDSERRALLASAALRRFETSAQAVES